MPAAGASRTDAVLAVLRRIRADFSADAFDDLAILVLPPDDYAALMAELVEPTPANLSFAAKTGLYLLAAGESRESAASMVDLSPDYLSRLANSREGRAFIAEHEAEARRVAVTARLAGLAFASASTGAA